ncbi:MAG: RNA polymerase sporulation sigma factor SigE [Clostridia bacterium]|nr:RNA polymerase sporulation sigma factor SigE [Clostridia bacterium]
MLSKIFLKIKLKFANLFGIFFAKRIDYINGPQTLPPPLSKDEETALLDALRQGDLKVKEQLIVRNLRLVVYIARKYDVAGASVEDIISIGTIGLIKAVNTFSPEKNIKLATYASRCIENEILMYIRKTAGRAGELSLDEPLNVDWDGNELLLSEILGSDPDLISNKVEREDECRLLNGQIALLNDRERRIMNMRFGLQGYEEHTQKEVADKLGISQSYISRLEKRIIKNLKKTLTNV